MSPFRNESATLEERQRGLGELALTLEQEGVELGAKRRQQPTDLLAFLVAAALFVLAFGIGDRVASVAVEARGSGHLTTLRVDQAHTLTAETTLGLRCDLASIKETQALLFCRSAVLDEHAGRRGRDPAP